MQRRALLLSSLAAWACAPRRLAAPPSAPRIASAAELIPADLDVVVRLDFGRMKAALGALTPALLSREVLARAVSAGSREPDELIVQSLLQAELVYFGYRPSAELLPLDRVLALEGPFEPFARPSGFSTSIDLGADLRYWDRQPGKTPPARSAAVRIYALGTRVRAFVSEAELDAIERSLQGLAGARRLTAPEQGTLSVAMRPRLLGRLARGTLRELLEDAQSLEAVVELESDGGKLTLNLIAADPSQAEQLGAAGKEVLARMLGERALTASVSVVADRLTLVLRASRQELGRALACLEHGEGSATSCTW